MTGVSGVPYTGHVIGLAVFVLLHLNLHTSDSKQTPAKRCYQYHIHSIKSYEYRIAVGGGGGGGGWRFKRFFLRRMTRRPDRVPTDRGAVETTSRPIGNRNPNMTGGEIPDIFLPQRARPRRCT